MTARMAADGQPVTPDDVRAVILRVRDRRVGRVSDSDLVGIVWLLLSLGCVFTMIGLIDSVLFCCHHWRGTVKVCYVSAAAAYLLYVTSRSRR